MLASKWLHDSCAVGVCIEKEYLEAVVDVLWFCWRGDCRNDAGSVLGTLSYGAVMGLGNVTLSGAMMGPVYGTLGCGDVVGDIVGIYVANILCRILMA